MPRGSNELSPRDASQGSCRWKVSRFRAVSTMAMKRTITTPKNVCGGIVVQGPGILLL